MKDDLAIGVTIGNSRPIQIRKYKRCTFDRYEDAKIARCITELAFCIQEQKGKRVEVERENNTAHNVMPEFCIRAQNVEAVCQMLLHRALIGAMQLTRFAH